MTNWWRNIEWAAILLVLLGFLAAWRWDRFAAWAAIRPGWVLLAEIGLIVIFLATLGKSKDRHFLGVLVDEADRISLARMQTVLWIIILYAGLTTILTVNIARGCAVPPDGTTPPSGQCSASIFDLTVPTELLTLIGITVAANGIASLVIVQGTGQSLRARFQDRADDALATSPYETRGILAARRSDSAPTLADVVRGSFATDATRLDFAKVQYVLLNLIIAGAYLVAFAQGMTRDAALPLGSFPAFDQGLNALLAISAGAFAGIEALKAAALAD